MRVTEAIAVSRVDLVHRVLREAAGYGGTAQAAQLGIDLTAGQLAGRGFRENKVR